MKLAIAICLNIIYSTISKSNFNNENRIGTYKMTNTFTAVSEVAFNSKMDDMGFQVKEMARVKEVVFSRDIPNTRFAVVIFSTLEGGEMRDSGADAIKVTLWDNSKGRPISSKKMF